MKRTHKQGDVPNFTKCGIPVGRNIVADDWADVDCNRCLKSGKMVPRQFRDKTTDRLKQPGLFG